MPHQRPIGVQGPEHYLRDLDYCYYQSTFIFMYYHIYCDDIEVYLISNI